MRGDKANFKQFRGPASEHHLGSRLGGVMPYRLQFTLFLVVACAVARSR